MVLMIFIAWLALAAGFLSCCFHVSNGARRERGTMTSRPTHPGR
jgi:hypothetical protein